MVASATTALAPASLVEAPASVAGTVGSEEWLPASDGAPASEPGVAAVTPESVGSEPGASAVVPESVAVLLSLDGSSITGTTLSWGNPSNERNTGTRMIFKQFINTGLSVLRLGSFARRPPFLQAFGLFHQLLLKTCNASKPRNSVPHPVWHRGTPQVYRYFFGGLTEGSTPLGAEVFGFF